MTIASFAHNCASWGSVEWPLFRTHMKYFQYLSSDGGRDWNIQEWPRVITLLFPQNWLDLLYRQAAERTIPERSALCQHQGSLVFYGNVPLAKGRVDR